MMESNEIATYLDDLQEDFYTLEYNESKAVNWAKKLKRLLKHHQGREDATETTANLIKCVSMYIQYLFNIAFLKNDNKEILLIRKYVSIVKEMLQSNANGAFLRGCLSNILTVAITENPQNWCIKKEVLKLLRDFLKKFNQQQTKLIMESLPEYTLFKLFDSVGVYGDYELQSILLEIMMRIYGQERINVELHSLVPESQEASQSLGSITLETFDEDVRNFLNILNKQYRYSRVFSIISKKIHLEEKTLGTNIWLDFNMCSRRISWYCSKSHFVPNTVQDYQCLITLLCSNILSIDIDGSEYDYNFHINLGKPCISDCEEVQLMLEKSKKITIIFENTQKSKLLISELLQKFMNSENSTKLDFKNMLPDASLGHTSCHNRSAVTCLNAFDDHISMDSLSQSIQSAQTDTNPIITPKNLLYEEQVGAEIDISQIQSLTQINRNKEATDQYQDARIERFSGTFFSALESYSNEENTEYETANSVKTSTNRLSVNNKDILLISRQQSAEIDFQRNVSEVLETDSRYDIGENSTYEFNLNTDLPQSGELEEISDRREIAELSQIELSQNKETPVTPNLADLASYVGEILTENEIAKTVTLNKYNTANMFMSTTQELLYDLEGSFSSKSTKVSSQLPLQIFENKNEKNDGIVKDTNNVKSSTLIEDNLQHVQGYDAISKKCDVSKTPIESKATGTYDAQEKFKGGTPVDYKRKCDRKNRDGSRRQNRVIEKLGRNALSEPAGKVNITDNSVKEGDEKMDIFKTDNSLMVQKRIEIILETATLTETEKEKSKEAITSESKKKNDFLVDGGGKSKAPIRFTSKEEKTQKEMSSINADNPDNKDGSKKLNSVNEPAEKIAKEHNEIVAVFNIDDPATVRIRKKEKPILKPPTLVKTGKEKSKESISRKYKKKNDFVEGDKKDFKAPTTLKSKERETQKERSSINTKEDDPGNVDGSSKRNELHEKHHQTELGESAGIVEKTKKGVEELVENVNIFKIDGNPTVQRPIKVTEKNILKSIIVTEAGKDKPKRAKDKGTKEPKKKKDFVEGDKENSKVPTPLKTKGNETQTEALTQKMNFETTGKPSLLIDTTKEKNVKEYDEIVNDFKSVDISKSPVLLRPTNENVLKSPTLIKFKKGISRQYQEKNVSIEDYCGVVLTTPKAGGNSSLEEHVKNLLSPPLVKTKKDKANMDKILRPQKIPIKENTQILKSPSVLSPTITYIGEDTDKTKKSNTDTDESSKKLEVGDITIDKSVSSPVLIKTKRSNTKNLEIIQIASKTHEEKGENVEKEATDKDCRTILKRKNSKKEILKLPISINEKEMETDVPEVIKTSKFVNNDVQTEKASVITEIGNQTRELEDIVEIPENKRRKRSVHSNDVEVLKSTKRLQKNERDENGNVIRNRKTSPTVTRRKMNALKKANLFQAIKQNILKERRRRRNKVKPTKAINTRGNKKEISKYPGNKSNIASQAEINQSSTDSVDLCEPNENTRAEILFENLLKTKSYPVTREKKKFQTNAADVNVTENPNLSNASFPELVVRLENFCKKPVDNNFDVITGEKDDNNQINLADSSIECTENVQPIAGDKCDMAVSNNLAPMKRKENDQHKEENVKCNYNFNEIHAFPPEPKEFSRRNRIEAKREEEREGMRPEESTNIITEVEVHEVPRRFRETLGFEEKSKINEEATTIPTDTGVNFECESEITKSTSDTGKSENIITQKPRTRKKLYSNNYDYVDTNTSTVIVIDSGDETRSTIKKKKKSKIMKTQKKTTTKPKSFTAKSKSLPLINCRTTCVTSTSTTSTKSIYHELLCSLAGCSSITELIQKQNMKRETSKRASLRKSRKPSMNIFNEEDAEALPRKEHHPSTKRKSAESHSNHSKKICVLSDVTLVPGGMEGNLDGNGFELDQTEKERQNDRERQGGCEMSLPLIAAPPNVERWEATAVCSTQFIRIRSQDYIGKRLLLAYFPMIFSPFNVINDVKLLDEKSDELAEGNLEILIITMDSPYTIRTWLQLNNLQSLRLPILSDFYHILSKAYYFSAHLKGFSLIDPKGEQVYLNAYPMDSALNINDFLAQLSAHPIL